MNFSVRNKIGWAAGLALMVGLLAESLVAQDWPQWRGIDRDGRVAGEGAKWPDSLGEAQLVPLWQVDLGEGYSGPVVIGDRVFTVETRDKEEEVVRAFELKTGKPVWEASWQGAMKVPFFARKNGSWARSTPASDGELLYVAGMRDVLVALDLEDGSQRWRVDFIEREGTELPAFGYVSSPLVDGKRVIVQAGSAVASLSASNSENRWRALEDRRAMFGSAFSSPILATLHGKRQVVAQTRSTLGGVDPESGEVLWSIPVMAFRGMNILTPAVSGNRIFTATYGGGLYGFEITRNDEKWGVKQVWQNDQIEGYMSSPVLHDGYAYLHCRDKKIRCIRVSDGEVAWTSDDKFGDYWSLVARGDRILALDERGELLLVEATPEAFRILDRRKLKQKETWAHLAVSGDHVVVRGLEDLVVYRWSE